MSLSPFDEIPEASTSESSMTSLILPTSSAYVNDVTGDVTRIFGPSNVLNMTEAFTCIYENKRWGNDHNDMYSGSSGNGSTIEFNTSEYIPFLKQFIIANGINVVTDLGCGTFVMGSEFLTEEMNHVVYTGIDCYDKVISYNQSFWNGKRYLTFFQCFDFYNQIERIPMSDLIILKDVFQHWPNACIQSFLSQLSALKKAKYILVVNCGYQQEENSDILLGRFHPLNCYFDPLKSFGFTELMIYRSKQVSILAVP